MNGSGLEYGVIGNGRVAALIDGNGRIVWWCFPRFDGNPVFSRLLAGDEDKGYTDVVLHNQVRAESNYERNTAIITTVLTDSEGGAVRITDFAPRFVLFDRMFHPTQIFRRIEPISGLPRIRIRVRPTFQYGLPATARTLGSSHIRYRGSSEVIRVTTDAPLSYVAEETPFALTRPITLVFGLTNRWKAPSRQLRAGSSTRRGGGGSSGCAHSPFRTNGSRLSFAPRFH